MSAKNSPVKHLQSYEDVIKEELRFVGPSVKFSRSRSRAARLVVQVEKPCGQSTGMISKFPYVPKNRCFEDQWGGRMELST